VYYRLAKEYHPDLNPQNAEKFKEISEAYKILKDPIKVSVMIFRRRNSMT
jgi:curved DNA-binding protein CbpA